LFKNKHVVIALIVAPILAIMSWFATGYFVDERPHVMKEGGLYTMNVRSNCRWASGECTLLNNDIRIDITGEYTSETLELTVTPTVELQEVKVAYDKYDMPLSMIYDTTTKTWKGILDLRHKNQFINFVFGISGTAFYAQVPTTFLDPKDNRFNFDEK
jgi:hypothetical protein